MNYSQEMRLGRFIYPILLINENKNNQINEYLRNHTLDQFYEQIKNYDQHQWIYCTNKQAFQFCIISTYKTYVKKQFLNYSTQHYKQMLKTLETKYFDCLHALLQTVHQDFPMYPQFVQLMFKYMLDSDEKLKDCIAQICYKNYTRSVLDYQKFLKTLDKMMKYCKNIQLKNKINDKVRKRIIRIINNQEDELPNPICPNVDLYYFIRTC